MSLSKSACPALGTIWVSLQGLTQFYTVSLSPGEYHKEYNTDQKPTVLKNALDRSVAKGWLQQGGSSQCVPDFYCLLRLLGKDSLEPTV